MTEEKSLADLVKEKQKIEKEEKEKPKPPKPPKIPIKPRITKPPVIKITNEWLESLIKNVEDEDYHKIIVIKEILKYTTTEKALHTCGEILKGKSLKRQKKTEIAREVKSLIDEKILKKRWNKLNIFEYKIRIFKAKQYYAIQKMKKKGLKNGK